MKLWEVFKALDENPEKEFKCADIRLTRESGTYRFTNVNTQERAFYMGVDNDWQEAPSPVTWQEALEAWANGKLIYVVNKAGGKVYRQGGKGSCMYLLPTEILHGTWYIED